MMMLLQQGIQMVPPSEVANPWPRILFWGILGTIILGGSLLTITRRNAVAAVMSLVGVHLCCAR